MDLKIHAHTGEGYSIKVQNRPDQPFLLIDLSGSIKDPKAINKLSSYLFDIHEKILLLKIDSIEIDFSKLKFINSGGIGAFVQWFSKISLLEEHIRYTVDIKYSKDEVWQSMSFKVLKNLLPDHLTLIEIKD